MRRIKGQFWDVAAGGAVMTISSLMGLIVTLSKRWDIIRGLFFLLSLSTSQSEEIRGLLETDFEILDYSQVTRGTSELPSHSPNFPPRQVEEDMSCYSTAFSDCNVATRSSGRNLGWTRHPHVHLAAQRNPLLTPEESNTVDRKMREKRCFELNGSDGQRILLSQNIGL
ncbi:hypothetical protein TNCV_2826921 [Trichonephila clavipes]|nr:hypothetical protein TNCV_2826921 [Trichonephila clavipes]